jgi:hypothetical protein
MERAWYEQLHEKDPKTYTFRVHPDRVWNEIYRRRYYASRKPTPNQKEHVFIYKGKPLVIPWVADLDLSSQYREPTDTSRRLIAAVSRRVLSEARPNDKGSKPWKVKAYRLVHNCLTPKELADGKDPYSKNKYWAWYLGTFDLSDRRDEKEPYRDQPLDPADPFLYWYLPIVEVAEYPRGQLGTLFALDPKLVAITVRTDAPKDGKLFNCLEMHAAGDLVEQGRRAKAKEGK